VNNVSKKIFLNTIPEFGEVLQQLMRARNLSNSKLGRFAKLDHSTIHRYTDGERSPTLDSIVSIASALDSCKTLTKSERILLFVSAGFIPPEQRRAYLNTHTNLYVRGTRRWSNRAGAKNVNVTRVDAVGRTL
jgi:transcriptional regulator with XRE-family HTH domain